MSSLINTADIDTEFPVAGQDNDSQGFRDNFTSIKTNLETAKSELTDLQSDTVKVNADSTFLTSSGGQPTTMIRPNFKSVSTFKFPVAANDEVKTSTVLTLNYADGDYQVYRFTQPAVELNFNQAGWPPAGRVGKLTVELTSTAPGGTTLSFDDGLNVKFDSSWNNGTVLVANDTNPIVLEFWTRQEGTTIFARNLGVFE